MSEPQLEKEKMVGKEWAWFCDYLFATAEWTAFCAADRRVEVGMGIKIGNGKTGENRVFSGEDHFTTVGGGALHFKVVDGGEPCKVVLYRGDAKGIKIPFG